MFRIEKLGRHHLLEAFDCGEPSLNQFLVRHALPSQSANASQTYVGLKDETVIGYYSLSAAEVGFEAAPERMRKGLARHPVPCLLLARLAVEQRQQGIGAGKGLLKDACMRAVQTSGIAGVRALVVHAKDEAAKAFYLRFGFIDGFENPLHLYLLTKDLAKIS